VEDHAGYCFCPACGVIDPQKEELIRKLAEKGELIEHLSSELVRLRRIATAAQNERDERNSTSPWHAPALLVFEHWKETLHPGAREFKDKRYAAVVARLKAGATVDELKQAIDGCALKPYVTSKGRSTSGTAAERNDELELICRDEANVTRFRSYIAPQAVEIAPASDPALQAMGRAGATAGAEAAARRDAGLEATYARLPALGPRPMERLAELRGWTVETIQRLGLRMEGDRVVIPVRNEQAEIVGLCRYAPNPEKRRGPKMVAAGARELFPAPESYEAGGTCWLCEGEADAIAAVSAGLTAVGVPGVATWKVGWVNRFQRFNRVVIVFDADKAGRDAAHARARTLSTLMSATVVDLAPARTDGYDVSDVVLEEGPEDAQARLYGLLEAAVTLAPIRLSPPPESERRRRGFNDPIQNVVNALERLGLRVKGNIPKLEAQCPAHDDSHASLSINQGVDGKAILHCHTGCSPDNVRRALNLEWGDLFTEDTG
jgi:hypothetical protein